MSALFDRLSEDARARLRRRAQPRWIDPALATLVHEPFSAADWLFEPKLDGERCLIFKRGGEVRILSRNRKDLGDTYPELVRAVAEQPGEDLVLDGEIVAFRGGVSSFARLQQRMQAGPGAASGPRVPVRCYVFDVLHAAGHDVTPLPLRERKKLLPGALDLRDPLRRTPYVNSRGEDYHARACRSGWEGVLAKDATSAYARGRSRTWLKFKCVNNQEVVIGGFTEPTGSRPALGALLIGYYEDRRLVYGGKVGTGFDDATLRDLRRRLDELERSRSPFAGDVDERRAHWVAPRLVAEVAFTEWTDDGKLRHPSYHGLRRDKDPAEVVREIPA
ncbi:non-homologous end-joining DNA ligase [Saccharopolyspora griseoalba]|uniref:DNA ligase (ATP) n=1 Tax=Saccharopolyspora griseoalba TaxID=1431848 RepID=A0ABW2LN59_9PSEU